MTIHNDKLKKAIRHSFRFLLFYIFIIWLELCLKQLCFSSSFFNNLTFVFLFSAPFSLILTLLTSFANNKVNKLISLILLCIISSYFISQAIYFTIFKTFYTTEIVYMAPSAFTNYYRETITAISQCYITISLMFLPIVLFIVTYYFPFTNTRILPLLHQFRNITFSKLSKNSLLGIFVTAIIVFQCAVLYVSMFNTGIMSAKNIYTTAYEPKLSVSVFGLATTTKLDIQYNIGLNPFVFDINTNLQTTQSTDDQQSIAAMAPVQEADPTVDYEPNILNIDFETLIENETDENIINIHKYFSTQQPSYKNEYTGMFEGKNLIFITAEGFWNYAVNEQYTPTLYKLANEGFVFENFYNPSWWASTTDGEFAATMGILPSSSINSFQQSSSNYLPFAPGNIFNSLGYTSTAYHNHTYTYYNRHITHPNMGYSYYGLGNGLNVQETWPESDLEMMQITVNDELFNSTPFHNYYMTISGHLYYSFNGNYISNKNAHYVEDLDMSEEAKAYIACQIELDLAIEHIINELKAAGEYENTVICISSDHYPYGLSQQALNEFYGGNIDMDFEVYRSSLIMFSGDMEEAIHIEKPCSSVDILPTLYNLFGIDYDSRLLIGQDILSTSQAHVVFANKSFITPQGSYNAATDTFTPNSGFTISDDYVLEMFNKTLDMQNYSTMLMQYDYYFNIGLENIM